MAGKQGNLPLSRKIFPDPNLKNALPGADIGFYIVSLVGQVIIKSYTANKSAEPGNRERHSRKLMIAMNRLLIEIITEKK